MPALKALPGESTAQPTIGFGFIVETTIFDIASAEERGAVTVPIISTLPKDSALLFCKLPDVPSEIGIAAGATDVLTSAEPLTGVFSILEPHEIVIAAQTTITMYLPNGFIAISPT